MNYEHLGELCSPIYCQELEHHGVIGMKWGIRRYQPYPSGAKRGVYLGDKVGHTPLKYKSPLARTVVSYAKYAANRTIALLVPGYALAYNAMVIHNQVKYNMDGKNYVQKDGEYETLKELKKKPAASSPEQDMKVVNPGSGAGRVNNCGFCTAAMEMRRRGYDVMARRKGQGISTSDYDNWFDGVKPEVSKVERRPKQSRKDWVNASYDQLCKQIEKNGDKSRGYVAFAYEQMGSGHTLFWEVNGKNVTFYDAQSGKKNPGDVFSYSDQKYVYARLDNCKLKPEVTSACVSVDYKQRLKEKKRNEKH